jgi:hypothetical protein
MNEPTAIAKAKEPLGILSYREVVININGEYYLENVNVLFGNKILKKIRFNPGEKIYKQGMGEKIAKNYLEKIFANTREKDKNRNKTKKNKSDINEAAKQKAAANLFGDLGL